MKWIVVVFAQLMVLGLCRETDIKIPKVAAEKQNEAEKTEKENEHKEFEEHLVIKSPENPNFKGISYDRKYMDMYNDDLLWTEDKEAHNDPLMGMPDGSGSPNHVKFIDYDFYDKYIVERWTNKWLAGDTTWVIAMTAPIAYNPKSSDH